MFIGFVPVYLFLFLPMRTVLIGETVGFIKSVGAASLGCDAHRFLPQSRRLSADA